jgi:hypothetical protein
MSRHGSGEKDDAAALLKKADKKASVSLTQWKPDHEGASVLYEQAATLFKNSGRKQQAFLAFEKLAACKEKLDECAASASAHAGALRRCVQALARGQALGVGCVLPKGLGNGDSR